MCENICNMWLCRHTGFTTEHWRSTLRFTYSVTGDVWQMSNESEYLTLSFQFCLLQKISDVLNHVTFKK
jgi:hypothetical protein